MPEPGLLFGKKPTFPAIRYLRLAIIMLTMVAVFLIDNQQLSAIPELQCRVGTLEFDAF